MAEMTAPRIAPALLMAVDRVSEAPRAKPACRTRKAAAMSQPYVADGGTAALFQSLRDQTTGVRCACAPQEIDKAVDARRIRKSRESRTHRSGCSPSIAPMKAAGSSGSSTSDRRPRKMALASGSVRHGSQCASNCRIIRVTRGSGRTLAHSESGRCDGGVIGRSASLSGRCQPVQRSGFSQRTNVRESRDDVESRPW